MRIKFGIVLVVAALAAAVAPVMTVTNGQPDGNGHPYVGIAIQPIPSMPGFVSVCSGSAISSTLFLTAAHCFDPAEPVLVSFKSEPPFGGTFITGTFHRIPTGVSAADPVCRDSRRTTSRSSRWTPL